MYVIVFPLNKGKEDMWDSCFVLYIVEGYKDHSYYVGSY